MQSYNHSEYLWFVFFMLSHYCSSYPLFRKRTRFGKVGYSLEFTTRSLPCLTELFYLFYPRGTGIKIIPENIYEVLTPIALAHVISGDGLVSRHGSRFMYLFLFRIRYCTFNQCINNKI